MLRQFLLFIYLLFFGVNLFSQVDLVFPKNNAVFDSTQIGFSWNAYPLATDYQIQIAKDTFFTQIINNQTLSNTDHVAGLVANERYFWRVKANNSSWSIALSFRIIDFRTWTEIAFILNPDSVVLDANGKVQQWTDLSGNGYHYTQNTPNNRPSRILNSNYNNQTLIDFNPALQNHLGNVNLSSLTQGEIFTILKKHVHPTTVQANTGLWVMGSAAQSDHYTWTDGRIYSGFGQNSRFTVGLVGNNINLTHPTLLNISSNITFKYRLNDSLLNTSNGTSQFPNQSILGKSIAAYYFDGSLGETLLFKTVLSDSLRNLVNAFYQYKYAPPINLGKDISPNTCSTTILRTSSYYKSHLWSDGSTADSLVVTQSGQYWCEVVDIFGNVSRDTIAVSIFQIQHPTFTSFCPGNSITWSPGSNSTYTYSWSDGSSADSLNISSAGDYYVQVTDTAGCTQYSDTLHFTEDTFQMQVSLGSDTSLCAGNFISLATGASQTTSYLWNTGEISPSIAVSTSGNYSVIVQNANGCEAKDTIQINVVGSAPTVDFTIPLSACTGVPIPFQDLTFTTDGSTIDSLHWSFGNSSLVNISQGNFIFDTVNAYPVKLYARTTSGCSQTLTKSVEVNLSPVVNFVSQLNCENQTINFVGTQTPSSLITNWEWNFDDPNSGSNNLSTGQTTGHQFSTYGNFNVQLVGTDVNGCADTVILIKNINPTPKPNFSFEEICTGGTTQFTNLSSIPGGNTITSYTWNFGNGSSSQVLHPSATYSFPGNHNVQLSVTSNHGCLNDTSMVIRVHDLPVVQHLISNNCAGLNTQFTNASIVNDGTLDQTTWQFPDGTVSNGNTVLHSFENEGYFPVIQTVTSSFGCTNTKSHNVLIHNLLQAGYTITTEELMTGYPIQFNNTSIGATDYRWNFGNFASSQHFDTTLVFPDNWIDSMINIQLIASNTFGCSDTSSSIYKINRWEIDLALKKILHQDFNGYTKMGILLKNEGTVPLTNVLLKVNKAGIGIYQEEWTGMLLSGDSTVYVFHSMPLAVITDKDSIKNYICIEGKILQPTQFSEVSLYNNQICKALSAVEAIIMEPYPNPVSDELMLRIIVPQDTEGKIEIVNTIGKLVYATKEIIFTKGLNEMEINTSDWAKGSYRILWKGATKLPSIGFVKN